MIEFECSCAMKKHRAPIEGWEISSGALNKLPEILKDYKGDTEVIFYDASTKKYVKATEIKIFISEDIIDALKEILGNDSVILK